MQTRSSTIDVGGGQLAYDEAGEGPPVLLLHAGICDRRMWEPQWLPLAEWFRVIRIDQRGFGESDLPGGPYSPREDVRRTLEQLGAVPAALVGASFGGSVAVDTALEHPQLVSALVAVGIGPSGRRDWPDELVKAWQLADDLGEAGDLEGAVETEIAMWVDGPGQRSDRVPPAVREQVRTMDLNIWGKGAGAEAIASELEPPALRRLGEIRVPTLVVAGDLDQPWMVAGAELLAKGIPGARHVVLKGTAHLPSLEQPEQFTGLLLEFLRDGPVARSIRGTCTS